VVVFLPSWQDMLLDGTCFEGKGIEPDIAVKAEPGEFFRGDPVLDAALKYLRGGAAK
jgi:C-terminal processing protease CtpA/Prc